MPGKSCDGSGVEGRGEGAGIGEGAEAAASDASERARGAHCGGAVAGESAANRGRVISRREKSPKRPYMVSMWVTFTSFLQIYLFGTREQAGLVAHVARPHAARASVEWV